MQSDDFDVAKNCQSPTLKIRFPYLESISQFDIFKTGCGTARQQGGPDWRRVGSSQEITMLMVIKALKSGKLALLKGKVRGEGSDKASE
jgi:hypothetical protein